MLGLHDRGFAGLLVVSLASCGPHAPPAAQPTTSAPARATPTASAAPAPPAMVVAYRPAANAFEILDNLSLWWTGKCDEQYRAYWEKRFGMEPADAERFATYQKLRKSYYTYPSEPASGAPTLFGRPKPTDRIAEAFYASTALEEAFMRFAAFATPEDVATLRAFFAAFEKRLAPLLEESRVYESFAANLVPTLNSTAASAYYRRIADFYGVTELPTFTVLYVFWPAGDAIAANVRGRFLLLKYNPTDHRESAARDSDLPVHELTHFISSRQPERQQQALTATFLAGCDPRATVAPVKILEEPMAVVHQKLFLAEVAPERFDMASAWYKDPWVSALAKRLFPHVKKSHESGGKLDAALMKTIAASCEEQRSSASGAAPR